MGILPRDQVRKMFIYLIATIVANLFVFTIWSKSSILNVFFKFAFLLLAVYGIFLMVKLP